MLRETWVHRHLVAALVRRQIQTRYRQSLAGFAWAIVPPLATLAAATLVFRGVIGVDTGTTPYALFAFAALSPWGFFANSLTGGVTSVINASLMVTRFRFPRAVLPLSAIGSALVDLGISTCLLLAFLFAYGEGLPLTALWYPVLLLIEVLFVIGIVLFASALNVFARDIRLGLPLLVQLWLLLTPVMYPLEEVPEGLRVFFLANPMTGLVESFRDVLIHGLAPDPGLLLTSIVGSCVAMLLGCWYFAATERRFADVI